MWDYETWRDSADPYNRDLPVFSHCEDCGEPIYTDDEYFEFADFNVCERCIDNYKRTAKYPSDFEE